MKRIIVALFGVLLLATACNNKTKKNETNTAPSEPQQPNTTTVTPALSQEYFLWDDEKVAIKGEIKDGGVWLTFDKEQVVYQTSNDEEMYRLPDGPVEVEGLLGEPQGICIGDIGQDFNPILCVLLPEGKVQILSLWNSISTGDLEATLMPFEGIVGFEAGPGGEYESEDGEINYDYVTIYGLDAQGGKHEVPLYLLEHNLEYSDNDEVLVYRLYLSEDWKMQYVIDDRAHDRMEEERGRFWELEADWDNMVFRFGYELTEAFVYSENGVKGNDEDVKGIFEIRRKEGEWNSSFVTPIEGIDFCQKGMNKTVKFVAGSAYGG
ncbi:MAG: hypothetical protein IKU00_01720 [Bacteroidales bacterium]|nr:hypothetical protein [Bacteroidales bacterium]